MKKLLPILLLPLLLAPREASAQYADPCAGVQCPAHSSCMMTTMGVVCGCDPGFQPTSAGCVLTRCTSSKQCEAGEGCLNGKCLPRETIDASIAKSRKVGIGLLVPGIILTAAGTAFIATGAVMFEKSRTCGFVMGIRVCDHDESTLEYRMYRGFMWAGIASFGAGLAMLIVGAVRLGRAKRLAVLTRLELTPYVTPVPGGGLAGLSLRF
jgi:hypothetical protein